MTVPADAELRQVALKALANRNELAAGAAAIAEAFQRAYGDLGHASAPLVGQVGVDALTGRTLYLAQRQYHWLGRTAEADQWSGPLSQVVGSLEQQDPAVALEAAGVILGILAGLMVTLIGRPLTFGLLQKAWPDAFSEARIGER